jgi:hypothetical protein
MADKTHIGFFLNLNKPSDREIDHILQTIPTYVSKTSYIKRAIAFYYKNCNDGGGYVGEALGEAKAPVMKEPEMPQEEEKKKEIKRETKKEERKENKGRNTVKEEAPEVKAPEIKTPVTEETHVLEPKPETEVKKPENTGGKQENDGNYVVSDNSDIDDNVDYDSFVDGFFS